MGEATSEADFFTRLFRGPEVRGPGGETIARRIASMLSVEPGDHVLSLGCGCGEVARRIARTSRCSLTCADRDEVALGALRQAARRDGVEGLVTPVLSDLQSLSVPPGGYQAVVVECSLRYLGRTFDEVIVEGRKLLGVSGLLVVSSLARVGRTLPASVEALFAAQGKALRQIKPGPLCPKTGTQARMCLRQGLRYRGLM